MFSWKWFTTPVGILITVGVLLLVIALVIFLVTKNKGKKEKKKSADNSVENMANAVVSPSVGDPAMAPVSAPNDMAVVLGAEGTDPNQVAVVPSGMDASQAIPDASGQVGMVTPGAEMAPSVYSNTPDMNGGVVGVSDASGMADMNSGVGGFQQPMGVDNNVPNSGSTLGTDMASVNPMEQAPVQNVYSATPMPDMASSTVLDNAPSVSVPGENVNPAMPTSDVMVPDAQSVPMDTTNVVSVENPVSAPVVGVDSQPVDNSATPIYGGATPTVPPVDQNVGPTQIYGGANPLENTQSVPIADITANATATPDMSAVSTNPAVTPDAGVATLNSQNVATALPDAGVVGNTNASTFSGAVASPAMNPTTASVDTGAQVAYQASGVPGQVPDQTNIQQ